MYLALLCYDGFLRVLDRGAIYPKRFFSCSTSMLSNVMTAVSLVALFQTDVTRISLMSIVKLLRILQPVLAFYYGIKSAIQLVPVSFLHASHAVS